MTRIRRYGVTVLGWLIVLLGVAALVLPGPGLLLLLLGLVILSQEYEWAERRVLPVKVKAFEVAAAGVRSWPLIALSTLGGLWLIGVGVLWAVDPEVPEFWIIGPELPFGGLGTGASLIVSGLVALVLLGYSMRRFRGMTPQQAAAEAHEDDPEPERDTAA